jgi:Do/DeqQ family serine protease
MRYAGIAVLASLAIALGLSQTSLSPGPAWASPDLVAQSDRVADVVEQALPSVVNINTTRVVTSSSPFGFDRGNQLGKSLGSGVIVSRKGYVITNNHVVAEARDIRVALSDGRELAAELVGGDPKSDLAVLRLKGKLGRLQPIKIGSSSQMRLGETVLAIGNPFGVGQTVTMGIVSAKGRANMGILDYEDFIQTDASINPGNSGGALINLRGELIGINTAILSRTGGSQGIGFAIPADVVKPIMTSLIKTGRVTRGWLGVSIQTLDDDLIEALGLGSERGVLVSDVLAGSPAATSGLRRNDVIIDVDGRPTRSAAQLRTTIASAGAEATVALNVIRDRQRTKVKVKLAKLPDAGRVARRGSRGPATSRPTKLGVGVEPVSPRARREHNLPRNLTHGLVITGVQSGTPAEEIGLRAGDVILEINRRKVKSEADLRRAYDQARNRLALLVFRDGSAVYITISKR